jgi:type I restriction enzyme M protein
MTGTGGLQRLPAQYLSDYTIPLPPLEVQQKIAAEIEGYQKVIDGARQVVDNWRPQIDVDPDWPMVRLGDVCEINPESSEPKTLFGKSKFVYLDISSVENNTGIVSFSNILSTEDAPSRARRIVHDDDILVSTVRPNLKAFTLLENLPDKCIASTGFAVLRSNKKSLEPAYLYITILSDDVIKQMCSKMDKGAYPSINSDDVKNILIPVPHITVQRKIAVKIDAEKKIVDGCRGLIVNYEEKIKRVVDGVWGE